MHGGLLAIRGNAAHDKAAADHGIGPIDLLVVNLYPFEATVAKGADYDTCVENIDIGGPAMIRGAAKNHAGVTVVVDPADYDRVLAAMRANGGATTLALRRELAQKAYARTAAYDGAISNWLGAVVDHPELKPEGFPRTFTVQMAKAQDLRYGENPHQQAAFYVAADARRRLDRHRPATAGQGAVLQQHRRHRRRPRMRQGVRRQAGLRHRQARQSLRRRRGRHARRRL